MTSEPEHASEPLRTIYGDYDLHVFSWSENEQDNVLVLQAGPWSNQPLVRVQSACYTGEIFESLDCDCHWQLKTSLARIKRDGGLFIYMLRDGRGAGLLTKIRGLHLTHTQGLDTAEAYTRMGVPLDPRSYGHAAYILRYFDCTAIKLLTNKLRKVRALADASLKVCREPLETDPTLHNREYLRAKAIKLGHVMRAFQSVDRETD